MNRNYEIIKHKNSYEYIIFMYKLCTALVATSLFLYGFFPIKPCDNQIATIHHIPKTVNNIKINAHSLYKPIVKKVVLMVIDGLRWDFVADASKTGAMPVTSSLIANKSACLQKVKVHAPTVTMPRIKAMTTGTASGFVDVALNFGKNLVSGDNVLLQAKNHGHNLIFYGDDTWLKLFPDVFFRHEGTTSFFVTDYTEVDDNVTRHIHNELYQKNDWSIMVLHYLGLDHIGHLHGPHSSLITPKLQEMDGVIKQIVQAITHWNENGIPSIFLVCGDHGMKDSGGHGGATQGETLVPLITFGTSCAPSNFQSRHIDQVDIASTLAMLLGIPFPYSSLGSVLLDIVNDLPVSNKLFTLYYNAKHVMGHFETIYNYKLKRAYSEYLNAVQLHTDWLNSSYQSSIKVIEIIDKYNYALKEMRDLLVQSMINYNLTIMNIAITLIIHILVITLNDTHGVFTFEKFSFCWISSIGIWLLLNCAFQPETQAHTELSYLLLLTIFIIFIINCYLCTKIEFPLIHIDYSSWKYPLSVLVHALSFNSSSFVEEEHETWYFLWATFISMEMYVHVRKVYLYYTRKVDECNLTPGFQVFILLAMHRILKHMNSTGIQYAHLPDISGWLKHRETNFEMSVLLIIALGLLVMLGYFSQERKHKNIALVLYLIIASCIYLRHVGGDTVLRLPFYSESRGIIEVQMFWITSALFFFYCLRNIYFTSNTRNRTSELLFLFIQLWVMVSALLHRPHNVILLPMQLISNTIVHHIFKSKNNQDIETYLTYCLGNVFYFYQGNSNSLATIDVAAGYVGLQSHNLIMATLFLCINTFSAPILAYLMLLYQNITEKNTLSVKERIISINRIYITLKFVPLAFYTIIISIQRYHLFIWSVFAPKLLYEAMYCAVLFIVIAITQFLRH